MRPDEETTPPVGIYHIPTPSSYANRPRQAWGHAYLEDEYLVTALVPSEMACLESSPGRMRRTEVWISREEMVERWLYEASLEASEAMRSKMSETNELRMAMALLLRESQDTHRDRCGEIRVTHEIPVSGWTCLRTL